MPDIAAPALVPTSQATSEPWRAAALDAIATAREAVASTAHPRVRELAEALLAIRERVAEPSMQRGSELRARLAIALERALPLAAEGLLDGSGLAALGDAQDALCDPIDDDARWARRLAPLQAGVQVATLGGLSLVELARHPFARPDTTASAAGARPDALARIGGGPDATSDDQGTTPASALARVGDERETTTETDAEARADFDEAIRVARGLADGSFRVTADDPEPTAAKPAVVLAPEGGEAITLATYRARVVADALDTAAMLANQRRVWPMSDWEGRDARLYTQLDAVFATGPSWLGDVVSTWAQTLDDPNPWRLWATLLLLGSAAGGDALLAAEHTLRTLPPNAEEKVPCAAEALAIAPHPDLAEALAAWQTADHPLVRAVAIEASSRRGALDVAALEPHLADPRAVVLAAAIRALTRVPDCGALPRQVAWALRHPDAGVAWESARALTLFGDDAPLDDLRQGRPLVQQLGERAVELFVMAGEGGDIHRLQPIVKRLPPTKPLLRAVGRFGSPGAWAFLAHFLGEDEVADAAEQALVSIFGPIVTGPAARTPTGWRRALDGAPFEHAVRYRRGSAWRPSVVAQELSALELDQAEADARVDELMARTGRFFPHELHGPWPAVRQTLQAIEAHGKRTDAGYYGGGWARQRA